MPIQVTCAACGGVFHAPDTAAGKRAKCPKCGGAIQIPLPAPPAGVFEAEAAGGLPPDDSGFDVEPPSELPPRDALKPCPMCGEMIQQSAVKCRFCGEVLDKSLAGVLGGSGDVSDPAWLKVRAGLSTLFNCLVVIIVVFVVMIVAGMFLGFMAAGAANPAMPAEIAVVMGICGLVLLGAVIGTIVGQARCTSVPAETGARGFAIGAVLCAVANVVMATAGNVADQDGITTGGNLIAGIGTVLFALFIRRAAAYLGDNALAASAGRFLIFAIAIFVGAFLLGMFAAMMQAPIVLGVLGVAAVVAALISVVWYLRLIRWLRNTIDERLAAG